MPGRLAGVRGESSLNQSGQALAEETPDPRRKTQQKHCNAVYHQG